MIYGADKQETTKDFAMFCYVMLITLPKWPLCRHFSNVGTKISMENKDFV